MIVNTNRISNVPRLEPRDTQARRESTRKYFYSNMNSWLGSLCLHFLLFVVLTVLTIPLPILREGAVELSFGKVEVAEVDDEPIFELENEKSVIQDSPLDVSESSHPVPRQQEEYVLSLPEQRMEMLYDFSDHSIRELLRLRPEKGMVEATSDTGNVRVNDIGVALEFLTKEFRRFLKEKPLRVVWCFDESESMQDEINEVRSTINKVHHRSLKARRKARNDFGRCQLR